VEKSRVAGDTRRHVGRLSPGEKLRDIIKEGLENPGFLALGCPGRRISGGMEGEASADWQARTSGKARKMLK